MLTLARKITVQGYTDTGYVYFSDCPYFRGKNGSNLMGEGLEKGDIAMTPGFGQRDGIYE